MVNLCAEDFKKSFKYKALLDLLWLDLLKLVQGRLLVALGLYQLAHEWLILVVDRGVVFEHVLKLLCCSEALLDKHLEVCEFKEGLAMLVDAPILGGDFNVSEIEPEVQLKSAHCDGWGVALGLLRMVLGHNVAEARRKHIRVGPSSLVFLHY